MLKVKLVPMTLLVPVIDNSGDHDCKIEEAEYRAMEQALMMFQRMPAPGSGLVNSVSVFSHETTEAIRRTAPPVSQIDPPIDTTVRDSEMRSSAPEMTLEELRERPERTKAPPRPRANSWRHE